MLEENVHSKEGKLLSRGPHTYKIPSINMIPQQFNVTLLKGAKNQSPKALYSSKVSLARFPSLRLGRIPR